MLMYFIFFLSIVKVFCQSSVTLLDQSNFNEGTFRITTSGTYRLTSNIIFNPNPASDLSNANSDSSAWKPNNPILYPNSKGQAFSVGFFAVISIETNNVTIDLNGFSISMHDHFFIQQRFFSIIDCNAPFESGTGPASFGSVIPIKNIIIMGPGKLGTSSHHGIHMNSVTNIIIKNLQIADFEVGGIQMNNFRDLVIDNVEIGPSISSLPNNVFYSNARFLLSKLKSVATRNGTATIKFADRVNTLTISNVYNNLVKTMNLFFKHIFVEGNPDINSLPNTRQNVEVRKAYNLFANKKKLPDGASLYGIILNSFGTGVFGFGNAPGNSNNAIINNVNIHDLKNEIKEVIGYYTVNNNRVPVRGPFSDVLDMATICFNQSLNTNPLLSTCAYKGNVLSDAQIVLSLFGKSAFDESGIQSSTAAFKNWALFDTKITTGDIRCGGDIMTHSIKGIMGIRLDNVIGANIANTKITNLINNSPLGSNLCGPYHTADDFAVFGTLNGYLGTHSKGIISTNSDTLLNNVEISNLQSFYGDVVALDMHQDSNIILNNNNNIHDLNAGYLLNSNQISFLQNNNYPNHYPEVCGIQYDETSSITLMGSSNPNDHVVISTLHGYSPCNNEFTASNVIINQPL